MYGSRPTASRALWLALVVAFLCALAGAASAREPDGEAEGLPTEAASDSAIGDAEAAESESGNGEGPPEDDPDGALDPANVETPAYPSAARYRLRDAFRLRVQSRFLPAANFDGFDADLYQPAFRFRATAPLSQRAVLQFTARFAASVYDFDGPTDFFGSGASSADPFDDLFRASLSLQGGFRLNEHRGLFVEREIWSILGRVFASSSWEDGAFGDGLTGGGSLALGYEIDDLIRLAVGVNLKSRIDRGGVKIGPILDLRWKVSDRFTVRNRGEGLQLEYALLPDLELFVAGFLDGQTFRLDSRPGLSDDLTFRDESVQAGAGFEWKISKHFRLNFEVGAVAWRELRVKSHRMGTLSKQRGDPSAYIDVRFELRP